MATQEFKLTKIYQGYPSKNKVLMVGTEEECIAELQSWLSVSRRNGADIVSEEAYEYTCDNYDSNWASVTFKVEEN